LNGSRPNPNLQIQRRGPNLHKRKSDHIISSPSPAGNNGAVPSPAVLRSVPPSLTTHLLNHSGPAFASATQQPFLSHAGCGTISASALSRWLTQDAHYARGYVSFVGQLIAKVRLPATPHTQTHILYRTMDALISALNNIRREMTFFEITATKYNLHIGEAPPTPICRAYLDLFNSASSPGASLLEGIVVLWATEHCYRTAWAYASSCGTATFPDTSESHTAALHQALIPNWTSAAFSKFVDTCRTLVDDLANECGDRNGREMARQCEARFEQVCWLEERFWPEVNSMGEERHVGRRSSAALLNGVDDTARA
jgi:thiaminase